MHNKNLQCVMRDLLRINGMSGLSRMISKGIYMDQTKGKSRDEPEKEK
jgi:hypothetical protein